MAGAVIGALRVVLGADTAAFEDGLKGAQSKLASFGDDLGKAAGVAALAMTALAVASGYAILHTVDNIDKLGKTAQKIGIPVEELSRLRLAAELSDISVEALGNAVVKLSKTMVQAQDPFTQANIGFKALGISVKDSSGGFKNSGAVIEEIAAKFSEFRDGTAKTALAVALFGKAGAEMIPLLNMGADGIRRAKEEADQFGLTLSKSTVVAAEAFNDNLKRLGAVVQGIITQVTAYLLPGLERMSTQLVDLAKDTDFAKVAATAIIDVFGMLATGILTVTGSLQKLATNWAGIKAIFAAETFSEIGKAWSDWTAANAAVDKSVSDLTEHVTKFLGGIASASKEGSNVFTAAAREMRREVEELDAVFANLKPKAPEIATEEAQHKAKQLSEQIASLSVEARVLRGEFDALAPGFAVAAVGLKKFGDDAQASFLATRQLAAEIIPLNFAMLQVASLKLTQPQNEFVTLNQAIVAMNAAIASGELNAAQLALAHEQAAALSARFWMTAGASIAGSFSEMATAAASFGSANSRLVAAAKVFGALQALIATYAGAAEALKLPFPANIAASIAVLAKGLTLVAAIRSFAVPSMAGGGSFTVPGGISGVDNKPMNLNLASGERVTVETPAQQRAGREITIQLQGKSFGFSDIRDVFEQISEAMGDGYRFRVVH